MPPKLQDIIKEQPLTNYTFIYCPFMALRSPLGVNPIRNKKMSSKFLNQIHLQPTNSFWLVTPTFILNSMNFGKVDTISLNLIF